MHQPGIEPGSVPWQGTILPLDHWCLDEFCRNSFLQIRFLSCTSELLYKHHVNSLSSRAVVNCTNLHDKLTDRQIIRRFYKYNHTSYGLYNIWIITYLWTRADLKLEHMLGNHASSPLSKSLARTTTATNIVFMCFFITVR